jgi:hypothetical protein
VRIFPPFFALLGLCLTTSVAYGQSSPGAPGARATDEPPIVARDAPRGSASLERARAAWNRGDFDTAETLYREALDQGALQKKDVLEAYVFMGSARAVQGKKDPALVAFREAALLDPRFKTPAEAGKRANQLAEVARKQQATIGQIVLKADMPPSIAVGQAFPISVTLDPAHVAILTRVGLSVNDGLGKKPFVFEQPAAAQLRFNVPGNVAVADARLIVKLVGLDLHDNELVTTESHVQVGGAGAAIAPARVAGNDATSAHGDSGRGEAGSANAKRERDSGGSKSIWSTPWPYLIGGVALAGAGGAVYFATRPGDQVTVTQVRVQAVR